MQPYRLIIFTNTSRHPLYFSSNVGHRLFLDTSTSLHRTFKSENSQMYRTFSSTIQPTNHRTGCLDLYNFHVAAQNPVISKPIVILLFSERSSLRCIVQPDGGSWHPKCLMNNSTKNAAPVHSFLKSTLPHYPLGTKPLYPLDVINGEFQNQWCHFGEEFLAAFGSVTPHPMPYKIISSL